MAETLINETQVSANVFTRSNLKSGSNLEFTNVTHKDNFDMVGTVTIINNIASGFSDANYLTMQDYLLDATSSFEVGSSFVLDSESTTNCSIIDKMQIDSTTSFRFEVNSENKIQARFSNVAGSFTYFLTLTGTTVLSLNTHYWAKVTYSSTSGYELLLSTDDTNWVTEATAADTTLIGKTNNAKLVIGDNVTSGSSFPGSIYLTDTYINVNGSKVWTCRELVNETVISAPDVYTKTNLIAGNNISIVQAQLPVIDNNTRGLYHFNDSYTDEIAGNDPAYIDSFNISYITGKFGKAIKVNGKTNSFVYATLGSDSYNQSSSSFTFDVWLKPETTSVGYFSFYMYSGGINGVEINNSRQVLRLSEKVSGTGSVVEVALPTLEWGTWFHFAYVNDVSTNKIYVFINGKKGYEATNTTNNSLQPCFASYSRSSCIYDELRISNVARWTEDFTPFSEPYSSGGTVKYQINSTQEAGTVDQTYDPTSTNAQSGTAVAEAVSHIPSESIYYLQPQYKAYTITGSDVTVDNNNVATGFHAYGNSNINNSYLLLTQKIPALTTTLEVYIDFLINDVTGDGPLIVKNDTNVRSVYINKVSGQSYYQLHRWDGTANADGVTQIQSNTRYTLHYVFNKANSSTESCYLLVNNEWIEQWSTAANKADLFGGQTVGLGGAYIYGGGHIDGNIYLDNTAIYANGNLVFGGAKNFIPATQGITGIQGYDATKTQVLKNVNGTLTWVDE